MKSKQAEQREKKERHKEALKQAKARRREEPTLNRQAPTIEEKPVILIVCEGENTERSYFDQFRLTSATIKTVGEGYNTVSLVHRAHELAQKKRYEQVWCVFDKDDFTADDFNAAIQIAHNFGYWVAYSNQAFEYWLILHFEDHQGGAMHRDRYDAKLNSYLNKLGCHYDGRGSKIVTEAIFEHLMGIDPKSAKRRVEIAIERAERICDRLEHRNPAGEESSTRVFELVREVLRYV